MKNYLLRILRVVVLWILVLPSLVLPIEKAFAENTTPVNFDFTVNPVSKEVQSGNNLQFVVDFKLTGSQTSVKDGELKLKLEGLNDRVQLETDKLSMMKIADVTPTYSSATHELTYQFHQIDSGRVYKTIIPIKTDNGYIAENLVSITGELKAADTPSIIKKAESKVIGQTSLVVHKEYLYGEAHDPNVILKSDDNIYWKITVSSQKKNLGFLYLKPDGKIVVTDSLPDGLEYVSDNANGVVNGNTVTWTFDAPTLAEQESVGVDESILSKVPEIIVKTKLSTTAQAFEGTKNVTNKTNVTIEDVGGRKISANHDAMATVVNVTPGGGGGGGGGGQVPEPLMYPRHMESNAGNMVAEDLKLPIHDFDQANFGQDLYFGVANSKTQNIVRQIMDYYIDPKLDLKTLRLIPRIYDDTMRFNKVLSPGEITWINQGRYTIKATVNGEERILVDNVKFSFDKRFCDRNFELSDLGLTKMDKISKLQFVFENVPPRFFMYVGESFQPVKGTTGRAVNHMVFAVEGYNKSGERVSNTYTGIDGDPAQDWNDRSVTIVPDIPKARRVIDNQVSYATANAGVIKPGENKISAWIQNLGESQQVWNNPVSYILLPLGTTINYAQKDEQAGIVSLVDTNYQQSGRQLVKVEWKNKKLTPKNRQALFFDVTVSKNSPTLLTPTIYSYGADDNYELPVNVQTIMETNADKMNPDVDASKKRIVYSQQYQMIHSNALVVSKLVKGVLDGDYSKLGHTLPGGTIDYRLIVKVPKIGAQDMLLMDVLPTVNDLGITDNVQRSSVFTPILKGPITLPSNLSKEVEILYSESENPSRTSLYEKVDYPNGITVKPSDPASVKDLPWLTEEKVQDWSKIHSFVIRTKSVQSVIKKDFTIDFSMVAPEADQLDASLLDKGEEPTSRAAWNSFAVVANKLMAVEPERVGVYVEKTVDPEVHKDVEKKQHLDLQKRDQEFKWHVNAVFGNTTSSWTQAAISDQINQVFDITDVKVADERGKDVTNHGKIMLKNNLVTFTLNKKANSYAYLAGHTYTMTIKTKIKDNVSDETLAPYIKEGGIPNQADLAFGNEGDVVHSEKPTVTPPPESPIIHKDVEKKQHLDLQKRDQEFKWHVNAAFGNTTSSWTQAAVSDQINQVFDITDVKVVDEKGKNMKNNGVLTIKNNLVTFTLNKKANSYAYLAGHTYTMTIKTKIKDNVSDETLAPYIKEGGIPNQADLAFGNEGDVVHSEKPTVTPPPESPIIHKDVEKKQHLDLQKRDQEFKWHVNAVFGNMTSSWMQAAIFDQINQVFDITDVSIVNENGIDVKDNGTLTINNNLVSFNIDKKANSYAYLAGHTYTMTIKTKIKDNVSDETLAPYIKEGGIPNQADLAFGNEGDVVHSEKPKVTPPNIPNKSLDLNTSAKWLPKTGERKTISLIIVGLLIMIIGGYYYYRKQK